MRLPARPIADDARADGGGAAPDGSSGRSQCEQRRHDDGPGLIRELKPESGESRPPADSHVALRKTIEGLDFRWRGRWIWGAIGIAVFITVFYNLTLFVLLLSLFRNFSWLLAAFLAPFTLVGVGMVVYLVELLVLPLRRETWSFTEQQVERRIGAPTPAQSFAPGPYSAAELHRGRMHLSKPAPRLFRCVESDDTGREHVLRLVRRTGESVEMHGLTEAEAQWIVDRLGERFPHWFR